MRSIGCMVGVPEQNSDSSRPQIGRTFKKKRLSQPIPCASAWAPRPRCSMRTLAICAEATTLPRLDHARVDLAGEAQHVDVVVDADLLLAGDQQVAVRQHAGDDGGDRAGEVVAVLGRAGAGRSCCSSCRRRWRG